MRSFYKPAFWSLVLLCVIGISFLSYRRISQPKGDSFGEAYNSMRSDVFNNLPADSNSIVFIGTSLTDGFPLNEMYQNYQIKNRGILGNTIKMIEGRLPAIIAHSPKQIFLEAGINDILQDFPSDSLLVYFNQIILAAKNNRTPIAVFSILPVCGKYIRHNKVIMEVNKSLADLCSKHDVPFLPTYPRFVKQGSLDPELTLDGVHFNNQGYQLWKQVVDSFMTVRQ